MEFTALIQLAVWQAKRQRVLGNSFEAYIEDVVRLIRTIHRHISRPSADVPRSSGVAGEGSSCQASHPRPTRTSGEPSDSGSLRPEQREPSTSDTVNALHLPRLYSLILLLKCCPTCRVSSLTLDFLPSCPTIPSPTYRQQPQHYEESSISITFDPAVALGSPGGPARRGPTGPPPSWTPGHLGSS
eukprot:742962-Hanusia_phi.AAC.1